MTATITSQSQAIETQHQTLPVVTSRDVQQPEVIKASELVKLLSGNLGAKMVTIISSTEPPMRKTANPFYGRVRKISRVNGVIGWQYESAVNRQRDREQRPENADGTIEHFFAEPRKWGERLPGSPWVSHKQQMYLELKVERVLGHEYRCDGKPIDVAELEPWLQRKTGESSRQGVEKEIILRDYRLDSILAVTFGGKQYLIEHETSGVHETLQVVTSGQVATV